MAQLALLGGEKTVTASALPWPHVWDEEIEAVGAALRSGDTHALCAADGQGPVRDFEQRFAEKMGVKYAITTCACGAALHTALMAAGVQAGDEVIATPYSWGQTVSCILHALAVPVFADIDPLTYTMDPATIEDKITDRTKAILPAHLYGHPADLDPIMDIARRHGLKVIADTAQSCGAKYRGRYAGSIADIGCFSIGSGKQIIGGEGGVLVTNDEQTYQRASLYGMHPARHRHDLTDPALQAWSDSLIYTYRIHPLTAVIANVMLDRMDDLNAARRRNNERISRALEDFPGLQPVHVAPGCEHAYHIYSPTYVADEAEGLTRDTIMAALQAEGVGCGPGYVRKPIHLRRVFREKQYFFGRGIPWSLNERNIQYQPGDCPVAEKRCAEEELTLGPGVCLYEDDLPVVDQIISALAKVAENRDVLLKWQKDRQSSAGH